MNNPNNISSKEPKKKLSISIQVSSAIENKNLCLLFQKSQKNIFKRRFHSEKFTSLDPSWMKNKDVYVIYAIDESNDQIIGGFRLHIANETNQLPVEKACGPFDKGVYDLIKTLSKNGCCELCALWISKEGIRLGLSAIHLVRAVFYICRSKSISNIITLAGPTTLTHVEYYNAKIYRNIGKNGAFDYPTAEFQFYISNIVVEDVLNYVNEYEKYILTKFLTSSIVKTEDYNNSNNLVIKYNLGLDL